MIAQTVDGRRLSYTSEVLWDLGRVVYVVDRIGSFTIERWPYGYPERSTDLAVWYGRNDHDGYVSGDKPLPEAPVVFGITICGAAVFSEDRFTDPALAEDLTKPWRALNVQRQVRERPFPLSTSAPDGTRVRVTGIVGVLVLDYLAREDRPAIDRAHQVRCAPDRLRGHQRTITGLRTQMAEIQAQLDRELALADAQAALTAPADYAA